MWQTLISTLDGHFQNITMALLFLGLVCFSAWLLDTAEERGTPFEEEDQGE